MSQTPFILNTRQLISIVALLLITIALVLFVRQTYEFLLLIFMGIIFAIFVHAAGRLLHRFTHLPQTLSLTLALLLLVGAALMLLIVSTPRFADQSAQLVDRLPQALSGLEDYLHDSGWGRTLIDKLSQAEQQADLGENLQRFLGVFSTLAGGLIGGLIVFVIGVYLAYEPAVYQRGLLMLLPSAHRSHANEVLAELGHALRWWLGGRLLSMLVVFLLTWLGLALLGMPLALLLAVIAGVLSFIPNIGPVVSALPAVLLGFTQGAQMALYVVLLYAAIQSVESYTITPLIQRRAVSVPPALLLTFQLLMGVLAGFIGLFAATPLLVAMIVLIKMLYIRDRLNDPVSLP